MHSVDLLIEALNKYEGSYILVSHDRYFVNKTANKIWEIEDHKIKEFVGTYDEWERWKNERKVAENNVSKKKEAVVEKNTAQVEKRSNNHHAENRDQQKEFQKLKKQFEQLEQKIAKTTEEKKQLEANLALPEIYSDNQKFVEAEKKYAQKTQQLQTDNAEYEKLFEKLMLLEEKVG
jgi:ATP-binding cassette subfamily F protein 3